MGHEGRDHGERCAVVGGRHRHVTVGPHPVGDAIEHEQFAVEGVERAEPEVAVTQQLADRVVAVVDTVEQRAHDADLVDRVALGRQRQHDASLRVSNGVVSSG